MPRVIGLLFLLCTLIPLSAQDLPGVIYTADFKDTPLTEVVLQMEQRLGFQFSYREELLRNKAITGLFSAASWQQLNQQIFLANGIEAKALGNDYVALVEADPKEVFLLYLCLRLTGPEGEGLAFATVSNPGTNLGFSTDENGSLKEQIPLSLGDSLRFQYFGYGDRKYAVQDLLAEPCPTIQLSLSAIQLRAVTVSEYLASGISATAGGRRVDIDPDLAPKPPGFADSEVYRSLALLPGIRNIGESAGDLSIRGGSRDHNLILWDGIPVYSSGHYFGMISNFSPVLVDEINVWRGQADASFGGRLAGVVNMTTDREISPTVSVGGSVSMLQSEGWLKVPVVKGKSDIHLSYRSSFPGLLSGPTYQSYRDQVFQGEIFEDLEDRAPRQEVIESFDFQEVNGRWHYQLNERQSVTLSGFRQTDDFSYQIGDPALFTETLTSKSTGLSLQLSNRFKNGHQLEVQAARTSFSNIGGSFFSERIVQRYNFRQSSLDESSLKLSYGIPVAKRGELTSGIQLQQYDNSLSYVFENSLRDSLAFGQGLSAAAGAAALFSSYQWGDADGLQLEAGIRMQYYHPTRRVYPEPRLSGSYKLDKGWLLKAGYGVSHQFVLEVQSLNPDQASNEARLWALANQEALQVPEGQELSFGFSKSSSSFLIDFEVYHKRINGLLALRVKPNESPILTGNSRVTGLDLLVKKRIDNWQGWVVYSLSKGELLFSDFMEGYFPADNDQRHQLQLMQSYKSGPWSFSMGWKFNTGGRYTGFEEVVVQPRPNLTPRVRLRPNKYNSDILPAYHRLDLSAFYDWASTDKKWTGQVGLSLLNVYGQNNLLDRRYLLREQEEFDVTTPQFIPEELNWRGLGFTPNVSFKIGWR